jgi:hypothetical protein
MTQEQYYKLRKHHVLLVEAKNLVKLNADKTANIKRFIAFKQEAGMMPAEYIERYDNCWKD